MLKSLCVFLTVFAVAQARTSLELRTDLPATLDIGGIERSYLSLFKAWQKKHGIEYDMTSDEHEYRFGVFKQNVDKINTHNRKHSSRLGWKMAPNHFMNLTVEEFKNEYLLPAGMIAAENANIETAMLGGSRRNAQCPSSGFGPKNSFDWVPKGNLLPIRNQGQCGSCWAFSSTGAAAAADSIRTGKPAVNPSVQQLVSCSHKGNLGCNGGSLNAAFAYMSANGGLDTAASYPYTSGVSGDNGVCKAKTPYTTAKVGNWYSVPYANVKCLIYQVTYGPVAIAVDASQWQFYGGGIFTGCQDTQPDQLDHGVLAVGFDLNGHWLKIANSWGESWGENGYIRIGLGSDNSENMCGFAYSGYRPISIA